METSLALSLKLVGGKILPFDMLIEKMAKNPARIMVCPGTWLLARQRT
ncbi:MAG: hypothetical protein R2874_01255 [Desulfobacterales bacterium]